MELATKRNKATARTDLVALATGHYSGNPEKLLDRVAKVLLQGASAELQRMSPAEQDDLLSQRTRGALAASLRRILLSDCPDAPFAVKNSLPVSRLSPEEVLKHTGMSKSTLYRGDGTRFYSVIPTGMQNGRSYPTWQFVGDVPLAMPQVLDLLNRKSRKQVNTFFVSEQDSLNELSPAEVLAGLPFEDRAALAPAQSRMLSLPQEARMDKVMTLVRLEVADPD